jgi:ketosteroid isomerase-like protein
MKDLRRSILGFMIAVLWLCAMSDRGSAADLPAAEAAVRKADADWAAAMAGNGVEAWMSFYAEDVIVLLPNDQPAEGTDLVRRGVARLLAPPHLAIAWHTTKVQMSRSGDIAFLTGVYELRFDDSRGTTAADRGTLLRIWRKQADGNWMCVVLN